MNPLPTGTVTFLFTDIEGSTRLLQLLGEGYAPVLATHSAIIRDAVAASGGTVVSTEGDSFFAVFSDASGGVNATLAAQRALAAQSWPDNAEVRVRMGLHSGHGALGGDNYVGLDVNRAARVAAAGHGGQVVMSEATRAFIKTSLPHGVALRDLGAHRLRDLAEPVHLYQLEIDGLATEFPALRTLDARANNLPVALTSFVGRDAELAAVGELLERARLVTLTGPGGTGKTRLALQVAAERLDKYSDGAFFVELAAVGDTSLVPSAMAAALRVRESSDRTLMEAIADHLRDRQLLLVLDNFEHLVGAARLVTELLAGAPRLSVLVTSRAPLRLRGEHEYPVPPLAIPDAAHLPTLAALSAYEGVALFIARASAARPDFEVSANNAPAIAEIVAKLDGLPLAIELAAAKCRVLDARGILGRLGRRLAFLGGGARDLPARQQTLREAIDWSFDLLSVDEQHVLPRLGVFAGTFDLDAVEAVVVGPDRAVDALELLSGLVEQSLVRRDDPAGGVPRFSMLQTIREYALERLAAAGDEQQIRQRHAEYFLKLAEAMEPQLTGSAEAGAAIERDHDNLRAALSWSIDSQEWETGLRLGFALWRFWQQRGNFREARAWFDRLLAVPGAEAATPARARGLTGAAGIAYWQNDYETALRWYAEAEEIIRGLGDKVWLADAIYNTGTTAALLGDMGTVVAKLDEGEAIARDLGNDEILMRFLQAKGYMYFMGDDLAKARPLLEEALAVAERNEVRGPAAGVPQVADRPSGEVAIAHHTVGQVARLQGRLPVAAYHYKRALEIGRALRESAGVTEPFQGLAAVAIASRMPDMVALGVRWLGAYTALRAQMGGGPPPEWLRLGEPLADAREILGDQDYDRAWRSGEELNADEAFAEAIDAADGLARKPVVSTS